MSSQHLVHHEIERQAGNRPDQAAFIFEDIQYTYEVFNDRTKKVANALAEQGVDRNDVVLAHARNHVDLYTLFYACSRLGCVYTTISTHQSEENAEYILETIAPDILFYTGDEEITEGMLPRIRDHADELQAYSLDEDVTGPDSTLADLIADADTKPVDRDVNSSDWHNIFWTSGTTGRPKAAIRNHSDSLNFAKPLLETFPYESGRTRLLPRDLMYVAPYLQYGLPGSMKGETNVILRDFSADAIAEAIQEYDVYVTSIGFTLGNQVLDYMLEQEITERVDKTHTALQSRAMAERFKEHIFNEIYHIYATTEVGLPLIEPYDGGEADPPTLGHPSAGTSIRIVEPNPDEKVAPTDTVEKGTPGELIVRGMTTMTRYLKDGTQAENVREGFVYTGDLVKELDDGQIQFIGRVDNRLRSGGVNVYPENIERVLENHPKVDVAIVVGVPDEKWGDRISALVIPESGVSGEELFELLDDYCLSSAQISRQVRPKEYETANSIDDVPTGALGKYDRSAIVEMFQT